MKAFPVRLADHSSPIVWTAHGETAEDALANWRHCFGVDFVVADEPGKAVRR